MTFRTVVVLAASAFLFVLVGTSQAQPAAPASAPAADDGSLRYEVIEVAGNVRVATSGTEATSEQGWTLVKKGDLLKSGQQVHVPIVRSRVKLVARPADPPTVLEYGPGTLVEISALSLKDGVSFSRQKLAYGSIKAGVAESGTRSDMEIATPVATLSKKGTDIFGIDYHDGHYYISLTEQGRGMLQAIQTQSTAFSSLSSARTRYITPGQWVTHQMARAIDNVQFEHNVSVNDLFGIQGQDQLFTLLNGHGFGFLIPQGNTGSNVVQQPNNQQGPQQVTQGALLNQPGAAGLLLTQAITQLRHQVSGDFGIGQGNLPDIFGTDRSRAQHAMMSRTATGLKKLPQVRPIGNR